jgi:hypothetical protein
MLRVRAVKAKKRKYFLIYSFVFGFNEVIRLIAHGIHIILRLKIYKFGFLSSPAELLFLVL